MATSECDFDSCVLAVKKSSLLFLTLFRCGLRCGKEEYSLWCRIMDRRAMILSERIVLTDLALQPGIAFSVGPWIRERSSDFTTSWDGYLFLSVLYSDRRSCRTLLILFRYITAACFCRYRGIVTKMHDYVCVECKQARVSRKP